jgi:hypothetical protein
MAGRPKANIDWAKVDKYLQAQCEATGIAEMLGISVDTLYNRCKTDHNIDFSAYCQQKKARGQELLRMKMYQMAMEGDRTMCVWLSKQYLGYKEKSDVTSNEAPIFPTEIKHVYVPIDLTPASSEQEVTDRETDAKCHPTTPGNFRSTRANSYLSGWQAFRQVVQHTSAPY